MRSIVSRFLAESSATVFRSITQRHVHVKSWRVPTVPNGLLKVRLGSPCLFRIYVQDPHAHNWDQALFDLHVVKQDGDKLVEEICIEDAKSVAEAFGPRVTVSPQEAQKTTVVIEAPESDVEKDAPFSRHGDDSRIALHVGIPGLSSLDIRTAGEGEVRIEGAIEGDVRIRTERANVRVDKVKASVFDADLGSGSLRASVLQASSVIQVDDGSVTIGRAQGPFVKVGSGCGDISIHALYTSVADIHSRTGNITLSGSQGTVRVSSNYGDVRVEGIEGRLDVDSGHGDVHADIAAVATAHVQATNGDVSIGLPSPPVRTMLRLSAKQVEVDNSVQLTPREAEWHQAYTPQKEGTKLYAETNCGDDQGLSGLETGHAFVYVQAHRGKVFVEQREWGMTLRSLWREAGAESPTESQRRGDA